MEAVIDQAGRIVVPKPIRDALGLLPGTKVDITRAGASGDRVFGVFPEGDLEIDEATPGSYDLQLGLALYGSRLAGFTTTNARAGTPAPSLSFLVELTRR